MLFEYVRCLAGARQPLRRMPLWLGILAWLPGAAGAAGLTAAMDLARDGRDLRPRKLAMLVLYSQADCKWCEQVRRDFLVPMQQDPAYRDKVVLRQIDLDSDAALTDFAGRKITHHEFAQAERAYVTPTVIVYGPDGARLAEPIVGLRIPDFYGAYLDRAIDDGLAKLRGKP